jgi:hypothetical protein
MAPESARSAAAASIFFRLFGSLLIAMVSSSCEKRLQGVVQLSYAESGFTEKLNLS